MFLKLIYIFLIIKLLNGNEGPLMYPEPDKGWNEGDCQSLQIQSPIDIPSLSSDDLIIDNGLHTAFKSLKYSIINNDGVKFDK